MYLCVLCYCDACLESRTLRVGVKTLLSLIPILVLLTSKMLVWTFWYIYYFYVNRHYLVQFLMTDLKQNERSNKKKSRQISSYFKR